MVHSNKWTLQNWTRVTQQYSPVPIFLVPNTTAVWLGFSSEDDYPVRNIDEPVRLSNEPARIGGPVRLRNEPVRVVKNLFNNGIWRTDPTPRERLWKRTGSTSSFSKPSYAVRFFQQSRLVSPVRGLYHLVTVLPFSYLLRKPSTIWRETSDLKTQRLVCWEREKLEPGNTAVWLGFSSEDDYLVRNIDEPVRLSNEPARIGGPVRLRNEPVRVVKNLFKWTLVTNLSHERLIVLHQHVLLEEADKLRIWTCTDNKQSAEWECSTQIYTHRSNIKGNRRLDKC